MLVFFDLVFLPGAPGIIRILIIPNSSRKFQTSLFVFVFLFRFPFPKLIFIFQKNINKQKNSFLFLKNKQMATTKDLALYTFWLRFWNEVDFGEVIVESDSWAQLEEYYGKEKIEAAVKKEWLKYMKTATTSP